MSHRMILKQSPVDGGGQTDVPLEASAFYLVICKSNVSACPRPHKHERWWNFFLSLPLCGVYSINGWGTRWRTKWNRVYLMDQLVVCFDGNVDALRTNYSARDGNGMEWTQKWFVWIGLWPRRCGVEEGSKVHLDSFACLFLGLCNMILLVNRWRRSLETPKIKR